ncbi:LysR family transcriptional regulator [Sphingomonas sp. PAMC 26617]|uniref:LysR family transcriptional regulator n=1 Tax=Sphingomonas sp. PAMC 26617 TaxID=1112216 RepID=UPI000289D6CC|nr:LysR family transcriptional regulator [Sphingomonas sp. PAMC 26617]
MSADDTLAFLAVAQFGGFTAAAVRLRQPKTNLVRRVRALESALGARLFDRTTRSLSLTEAGQAYRQHLGDWGTKLVEAEQAVKDLQGEAAGWIRISLAHSLAVGAMAPLLVEFGTLHPRIRFDLLLDHRSADLVADDVDIALRMGPLSDSALVARRLTRFPNRVHAAPAYLEQHGAPLQPADLMVHATLANRLAQRKEGHAWGLINNGAMRDYPIAPVMIADDPSALLAALEAGRGLMLATDALVAPLVKAGRVLPVLSGWTGRMPELHAVFPTGRARFLKIRLFVDFLAARFATLNTGAEA